MGNHEEFGTHDAAFEADRREAEEESHLNQLLEDLKRLDDEQLQDVKKQVDKLLKERE